MLLSCFYIPNSVQIRIKADILQIEVNQMTDTEAQFYPESQISTEQWQAIINNDASYPKHPNSKM